MAITVNIPTLVSQSISDGVTAFAPSENAVFDALALKQNLLYRSITVTPSATLTGTTVETELLKITIPANTLTASEILEMKFNIVRAGTGGNIVYLVKMSTSATLPAGSTGQIARRLQNTTNTFLPFERTFKIQGGNIIGALNSTSLTNDLTDQTLALSTQAFDHTVTNYLYLSATMVSAADSTYMNYAKITN